MKVGIPSVFEGKLYADEDETSGNHTVIKVKKVWGCE